MVGSGGDRGSASAAVYGVLMWPLALEDPLGPYVRSGLASFKGWLRRPARPALSLADDDLAHHHRRVPAGPGGERLQPNSRGRSRSGRRRCTCGAPRPTGPLPSHPRRRRPCHRRFLASRGLAIASTPPRRHCRARSTCSSSGFRMRSRPRSMNVGFCRWIRRRARSGDVLDVMVHEPGLGFGEGSLRHNAAAAVHRLMLALLLSRARRVWIVDPRMGRGAAAWTFGRRDLDVLAGCRCRATSRFNALNGQVADRRAELTGTAPTESSSAISAPYPASTRALLRELLPGTAPGRAEPARPAAWPRCRPGARRAARRSLGVAPAPGSMPPLT